VSSSTFRTRLIPYDDGACGWNRLLPPLPPPRRVAGELRADAVVVGAGFTGLAAARRLAEHDANARIIVLEAARVGSGASGRNSGFVVDVGHWVDALGLDGNARLVRLQRSGRDALRRLVHEHGIACAWSERGRLHGAAVDAGMRELERFARGLEALREPYESLDAAARERVIGTPYYRAAMHTPGTVLVQPAALVRGLAATLPPNVDLFEQSPVLAMRIGAPHRLETPAGAVFAPRLLLATNGWTPAVGLLRRRVVPLFTFASLTRPLTAEERVVAGDPEWGLVSEERMGSTVRRTRDHRLLVRNSVRYAPDHIVGASVCEDIARVHRRALEARFPALRAVETEFTWGGVMGVTLNGAQFFGRIATDIFASVAYNGVGIAMGTASGALLADLVVAADSELLRDMQALPGPTWIPPAPVLGVGVRTTVARFQRRAGAEL
jgi:glycine/D-amino acid oxidase-like deaminating enzyme